MCFTVTDRFGQWGLNLVAHFYNQNLKQHGGKMEGVYTSKTRIGFRRRDVRVLDKERGVVEGIWLQPWQTDDVRGALALRPHVTYKTPKRVVDML